MVVEADSVAPDVGLKAVSTWNGAFGRFALCACVTTGVIPAAVTPPHVCGSTGSRQPSRSRCGA